MDEKIKKILNDIYMIDDSLKEKEGELVKIIEELLRSKPDAKIDDDFVKSLQEKLLARLKATVLKEKPAALGIFGFRSKLAYSLFGMLIALIALAPMFFLQNKKPANNVLNKEASAPQKYEVSRITKLADNAFGIFSSENITKSGSASGKGGGGGIGGGGAVSSESASGKNVAAPSIMPVDFINYKYVYKGGAIPAIGSKAYVYSRSKDQSMIQDFSQLLQGVNSPLLNLDKLQNIQASSISFSEDREFGYEVNILPKEGTVYIYANWLKWPNPYAGCDDAVCSENLNLKAGDMPSDEELVGIANSFMGEYGISREGYGEAEVVKTYLDVYASKDQTNVFIPDIISVVYPLKVGGVKAYDLSGEKDGIFVDINIRYKKVSAVRNLYAGSFESSGYDAETDAEKIKSIAEKGGLYADYAYNDAGARTVFVELGTPSIEFIKTWKYDADKQAGREYFVPSYVFPILNKPEGYFYKKFVIVPAIKGFMDDNLRGNVVAPFSGLER